MEWLPQHFHHDCTDCWLHLTITIPIITAKILLAKRHATTLTEYCATQLMWYCYVGYKFRQLNTKRHGSCIPPHFHNDVTDGCLNLQIPSPIIPEKIFLAKYLQLL